VKRAKSPALAFEQDSPLETGPPSFNVGFSLVVDASTSRDDLFSSVESAFGFVEDVFASVDDEASASVAFFDHLTRAELRNRLRIIGSMVGNVTSTIPSIPSKQNPTRDL
jgi:hypothetical protein